jgi:hypothetical protein
MRRPVRLEPSCCLFDRARCRAVALADADKDLVIAAGPAPDRDERQTCRPRIGACDLKQLLGAQHPGILSEPNLSDKTRFGETGPESPTRLTDNSK